MLYVVYRSSDTSRLGQNSWPFLREIQLYWCTHYSLFEAKGEIVAKNTQLRRFQQNNAEYFHLLQYDFMETNSTSKLK